MPAAASAGAAASARPGKSPSFSTSLCFRQKRKADALKLYGKNQSSVIQAGWLKGLDREAYRIALKQVLLLAAGEVGLYDLEHSKSSDPHAPAEAAIRRQHLEALRAGTARISAPHRPSVLPDPEVAGADSLREGATARCLLVKYGAWLHGRQSRGFTIEGGRLMVYKSREKNAPLQHSYNLAGAECVEEKRLATPQDPPFEHGYNLRLRVKCRERNAGPMLLYCPDSKHARQWILTTKMAKHLQAGDARLVLQSCIRRVAQSTRCKAWEALVFCSAALSRVKLLVHEFGAHLELAYINRGWRKLNMVYRARSDRELMNLRQSREAARILAGEIGMLANSRERPLPSMAEQRQRIISWVQTAFRVFRDERAVEMRAAYSAFLQTHTNRAQSSVAMGLAFDALSCAEAIELTFDKETQQVLQGIPEAVQPQKVSYSSKYVSLSMSHVKVSDCNSMLLFSDSATSGWKGKERSEQDWMHFVRLREISSVVLYSERINSQSYAVVGSDSRSDPRQERPQQIGTQAGCWFTLHGPRLCWGQRARPLPGAVRSSNGQNPVAPTSTADRLEIVNTLLGRGAPRGLRISITLRSMVLSSNAVKPSEDGQSQESHAVMHLLGRRCDSFSVQGPTPEYECSFDASVMIPNDPKAVSRLDESEFCLDVVDSRTFAVKMSARIALWRLLATGSKLPSADARVQTLAESLNILPRRAAWRLPLSAPGEPEPPDELSSSFAHIEAAAEMENLELVATIDKPCMSPELLGRGPLLALYSSHRALWFDPQLWPARFHADNVPSFVELSFGSFRFPVQETPDPRQKPCCFYVEVTCVGASAVTPARHRPHPAWTRVISADPQEIRFDGVSMFLPLPPGFWTGDARWKQLRIVLFKRVYNDPTRAFQDFLAMSGRPRSEQQDSVAVYHAHLTITGQLVNRPKQNVSIPMASASQAPAEADLDQPLGAQMMQGAVLAMSTFALRDREFVRTALREDGLSDQACPLCIGDKAMLSLEEVLVYPKNRKEFKSQLRPGSWNAEAAAGNMGFAVRDEVGRLRDPRQLHEYEASGFAEIQGLPPFQLRPVPNECTRPIPFKYVHPISEHEFYRQHLPGVFRRVVADTASRRPAASEVGGTEEAAIVERLTHVVEHMPCTLLAMYADQTCDVELGSEFLRKWEASPERRFLVPGTIDADVTVPGAPRAVLRGVPAERLSGVHGLGFNVYDASLAASTHVLARPQGQLFHPRHISGHMDVSSFRGALVDWARRGGLCPVAAGPMPGDVCAAACSYEWSMHLFAPSESAMHEFVATLQHCLRRDSSQQVRRVRELLSRTPTPVCLAAAATAATTPPGSALLPAVAAAPPPLAAASLAAGGGSAIGSSAVAGAAAGGGLQPLFRRTAPGSGRLEVLLVEARRLRPRRARPGADSLDACMAGKDPSQELSTLLTDTELNVAVNFRILSGGEALIFKGSQVQTSPSIHGTDSPDWSRLETLQAAGGWAFRSAIFVPDRMPDMTLDLAICHKGITKEYILGSIQLPITKGSFLTDPRQPFRNLWLPLTSQDADGRRRINPSGEVHIMTLWMPVAHDAEPAGKATAYTHFLALSRPPLATRFLRDPVFDVAVPPSSYNPNLAKARGAWPRTFGEELAARAAKLSGMVAYLECSEQRQLYMWSAFRSHLARDGLEKMRLGELRLVWLQRGETSRVKELEELLRGGVPNSWRSRVWPDVSLSSRLQAKRSEGDYVALVDRGNRLHSCSTEQLQEDIVDAGQWEPSSDRAAVLRHMQRLRAARNVCLALIAFSVDADAAGTGRSAPHCRDMIEGEGVVGAQVAYCQSLLVLAFHLLLPQGRSTSAALTEADAFWLLYTLIGARTNGAYRDYYAAVPGQGRTLDPLSTPPTMKCGAMEDVYLLDCALAVHVPELWNRLHVLGFQLASVFYRAFMHLFARMMPTGSVFRLWDILLAESSNPNAFPHARHPLIDFAFGVLQSGRAALLRAESAAEVQDQVLALLADITEPETVSGLAAEGNDLLWGGFTRSQVLKLWHHGTEAYDRFYEQYATQNEVLQELAHSFIPGRVGRYNLQRRGLSTLDVVEVVMPTLQECTRDFFGVASGGMFRAVPHELLELGTPLEVGKVGEVLRQLGAGSAAGAADAAAEKVAPAVPEVPAALKMWRRQVPAPRLVELPEGTEAQPCIHGFALWREVVESEIPAWTDRAEAVYQAFAGEGQQFISLNELLVGLISCSNGTVMQKAMALFDLYSHYEPSATGQHGLLHRVPVSPLLRVAAQRAQDKVQSLSRVACANIPPPLYRKAPIALHFRVVREQGRPGFSKGSVMGEVVVPELAPFVAPTGAEVAPLCFSIWALEQPGSFHEPSSMLAAAGAIPSDVPSATRPPCPCLGELVMSIKWVPSDPDRDMTTGQLTIRVYAIRFFGFAVQEPRLVRPCVTVAMREPLHVAVVGGGHTEELRERNIPRLRGMGSPLAMPGAGEEFIDFMEPETRRGSGWDPTSREWRWPASLGEQRSIATLSLHPACFEASAGVAAGGAQAKATYQDPRKKRNVISLWSARLVFENVLRRGFNHVTNRQSALLADAAFSRSGAVPGVTDAVLTEGSLHEYQAGHDLTVEILRVENRRRGRKLVDVTRQIIFELERQCSTGSAGSMSLILYEKTLKDLRIKDPLSGVRKLLAISFLQAGNGDRNNTVIQFDEAGRVVSPFQRTLVELDPSGAGSGGAGAAADHGSLRAGGGGGGGGGAGAGGAAAAAVAAAAAEAGRGPGITKDEFVSAVLATPLLSETLRRMSPSRQAGDPRVPLALDVTVAQGPDDDELEQQIPQILHERVLVEVWSYNRLKGDSFLGEAWLPPVTSLAARAHALALPLLPASSSSGTGLGPRTRPDARKTAASEAAGSSATLFLSAAWVPAGGERPELLYPSDEEQPPAGELTLHLQHVEGLRATSLSDVGAYMAGYAWSPSTGCWRQPGRPSGTVAAHGSIGGLGAAVVGTASSGASAASAGDVQLFKTKPSHGQRQGEAGSSGLYAVHWDQEVAMRIYEHAKVPERRQRPQAAELPVLFDSHAAAATAAQSAHAAAGGEGEPQPFKDGAGHGVEVYLSDTIQEFLTKLSFACKALALQWERSRTSAETAAVMAHQYRQASDCAQHAVLAFLPAATAEQTLSPSSAAEEEEEEPRPSLMIGAHDDPSNWLPLDPVCTFGDYASRLGLGSGTGMFLPLLRVTRATRGLRLRNHRFRQYVQEKMASEARPEDVNEEERCFAWARHSHVRDGGSAEWRPCLVRRRAEPQVGGRRCVSVSWVFHPPPPMPPSAAGAATSESGPPAATAGAAAAVVEESAVLLAPVAPRLASTTEM